MTALSIVGIFLGLVVLVACSMKGLSVFISAILASVVIALTGSVGLQQAILTALMTCFVTFLTGNIIVCPARPRVGKA